MPSFFFNQTFAEGSRGVKEKIFLALQSFSKTDRILFAVLGGVFVASGAGILFTLNSYSLIEVPRSGGQFTEGILGSPRFVNPVLAVSQADQDTAALVYSGLMRLSPSGVLIFDLAESYSVSEDGREYTFILKKGITWHDGEPIVAEDIRFTIEKIQDPNIRSPKRGNWEGIGIRLLNERTVAFTLPAAYASFLENTTVGILPSHLFSSLSPEEFTASSLNTDPIGSGPYRVESAEQDMSGIPEYYDLAAFANFALGMPYIENIRLSFYANENELLSAFKNGEIDSASSLSPERIAGVIEAENAASAGTLRTAPLPRVFGVFFNQNEQEIFTDASVRKALDKAIDKDKIVSDILFGHGEVLSGPFPPGALGFERGDADSFERIASSEDRLKEARSILLEGGWVYGEGEKVWKKKQGGETKTLAFSLSTSDVPELKAVAETLVRNWSALGAQASLKVFEAGELNQSIIRPRKYDALLFGIIVGRSPDPYAFWHSSQRLDPGLNIALYANPSADKILEESREALDERERVRTFREFREMIAKDSPAAFLYSPEFLYLAHAEIKNIELPPIMYPSERFAGVMDWSIETDKVWKIFAR